MVTGLETIYRHWSKAAPTPWDASDRKLVKADFEYPDAENTFTVPWPDFSDDLRSQRR